MRNPAPATIRHSRSACFPCRSCRRRATLAELIDPDPKPARSPTTTISLLVSPATRSLVLTPAKYALIQPDRLNKALARLVEIKSIDEVHLRDDADTTKCCG